MIALNDRTIGDRWVIHAYTSDDVSEWIDVVVAMRQSTPVIATSRDGSIVIDGADDIDPSSFTADGGDLWIVVPPEVTVLFRPGRVIMEVSYGGDVTAGTFTFVAQRQVDE